MTSCGSKARRYKQFSKCSARNEDFSFLMQIKSFFLKTIKKCFFKYSLSNYRAASRYHKGANRVLLKKQTFKNYKLISPSK